MADWLHALELAAWWQKIRARTRDDHALASVLSWIRTIGLEDDVVYLETPREPRAPGGGAWRGLRDGYYRFGIPSLPTAHPEPIAEADARRRVRFVVRARAHGAAGGRARPSNDDALPTLGSEPGWRSVLTLRDLVVIERDAPHGRERPLRLGLSAEEGAYALMQARRSAERFLTGVGSEAAAVRVPKAHPRLAQRTSVALAVWTRGRLRGSVILSPGPALRTVGQAAVSACQDSRFPRLVAAELADTVFQVGFLHAPRVPLSRREIETCDAYPEKALFVSDGARSGVYMPEAFNLLARRTARLHSLVKSIARDKAGLSALGPSARIEVNEVTEVVESADANHALGLDGPVARWEGPSVRAHAPAAGRAACDWLAAIQAEDGSLPLYVQPSTGKGEGVDYVRSALTAQALAAFGVAHRLESAVENGRRVLAWLERSRPAWSAKGGLALATAIYRGKAALELGDDAAADAAAASVLEQLEGADPGPIVLAEAASLLDRVSVRQPRAARRCESLRSELLERFRRARSSGRSVALAEWAELGAALPARSEASREVLDWLRDQQLPSGAFPESTHSDFVYSRGTAKVFEILALRPTESPGAVDRALGWLFSMQYRPDSVFFVPCEQRRRVEGGLRHDYFGPDAWIDAAGHLLLGLARLGSR
jgi:AMMECR1 domain-containing protein